MSTDSSIYSRHLHTYFFYDVRNKWMRVIIIVDFGEKIKHLRNSMGLTQVQMAERLHISKSMASSYETGIRLPSYDVLIKFAKLFGVTTDYLLGFDMAKTVDVTGLTDSQVDIIIKMVNELRKVM